MYLISSSVNSEYEGRKRKRERTYPYARTEHDIYSYSHCTCVVRALVFENVLDVWVIFL